MSASDKKKIRREQAAQYLSERQRQEQAEAKKLKAYTIAFVSAMIAIICIALGVLAFRFVEQNGLVQKSTIAANIGNHKLNTVEMSYYYIDSIDQFYNEQYEQFSTYTDTYLNMMGLDTTKPLTEQTYDQTTGQSWADYFLEGALEQARKDYALYDKAVSENFQLPEEDRTLLDTAFTNIESYAAMYGYANADKYLSVKYGPGSSLKSYKEYSERSSLAAAYYNAHKDSLTYDDAAIREYESDKFDNFTAYDYSACYLTYTEFSEGGVMNEETGSYDLTPEQAKAAREKLEEAVAKLKVAKDLEELKTLVKEVKVNANSQTAVNSAKGVLHTEINPALAKWLSDKDRKVGDLEAIPTTTTTTNEAGEEVEEITGYYVAVFEGKNDNTEPMGNVRHLLVEFEGGTLDEEIGETVYSEEEEAAAKAEAEGYLKAWQEGAKTEESFIELVKEHSDDSSAAEGGLFEDINPDSQYVAEFLEWSINPERKAGDAEVIRTQFGYHVMYYVGDDELSYRDLLIKDTMLNEDMEEWYSSILDSVTATLADTSKMKLDLTLGGA